MGRIPSTAQIPSTSSALAGFCDMWPDRVIVCKLRAPTLAPAQDELDDLPATQSSLMATVSDRNLEFDPRTKNL